MKTSWGILRLTGILLVLVVGGLGIARVLDLMSSQTFQEWLVRMVIAVAIVGGIGLVVQALKGGESGESSAR